MAALPLCFLGKDRKLFEEVVKRLKELKPRYASGEADGLSIH